MTAWHENARFDVFAECDVFVEDSGRYLYVENKAFDYNGYYCCHCYQQGTNLDGTKFYLCGEWTAADNEYVMGLEPAPWNIARDLIAEEMRIWAETVSVDEDDVDFNEAEDILLARKSLLEDAVEGEKFTWC